MTEYFSSLFEPFGMLEFSSEDPLPQRIYEAMRDELGQSFQQFSADAETYAEAMTLATSQLQIDAAAAQDDPSQTSYLMSELEKDYGIRPVYGASLEGRRAELSIAKESALGCFESVITNGLTAILGDGMYGWRFMIMSDGADNEVELSTLEPVISPVYTPIKNVRTLGAIAPGVATVAVERLFDAGNILVAGEKLTVDTGNLANVETVAVTSATATAVTATFTKCHAPGALCTTGSFPLWVSSKCHAIVAVSDDVLHDLTLQSRANAFLRKAMPATSTWALVQRTQMPPLGVGPFAVGEGLIGQTPIGTAVIEV